MPTFNAKIRKIPLEIRNRLLHFLVLSDRDGIFIPKKTPRFCLCSPEERQMCIRVLGRPPDSLSSVLSDADPLLEDDRSSRKFLII